MRRELDLTADIVGGFKRESQERFGTRKGLLRDIEPLHPRDYPKRTQLDHSAAESRKTVEGAVEHHCGQERLRGSVQNREVFGVEILSASEPPGLLAAPVVAKLI